MCINHRNVKDQHKAKCNENAKPAHMWVALAHNMVSVWQKRHANSPISIPAFYLCLIGLWP